MSNRAQQPIPFQPRVRPGIECEKCGHGTFISQTRNLVSLVVRVRTCSNPLCRYTFDTVERKIAREDVTPLFKFDPDAA